MTIIFNNVLSGDDSLISAVDLKSKKKRKKRIIKNIPLQRFPGLDFWKDNKDNRIIFN